MTLTLVFWQGLEGSFREYYKLKTAPVAGPLDGIGRCGNLPYLGNQGDNMAYSPQELKRRVLRVFQNIGKMNHSPHWVYFPIDLHTWI